MTSHSSECARCLAELRSAPLDSVTHRMAVDLESLGSDAARDYLITIFTENPAGSVPVSIAFRLWPLLNEVSEMNPASIAYVKALREAKPGSLERVIGDRIWKLSKGPRDDARDNVLDYLNELMIANARGSEGFEIAYEIWWSMGERGVAA